MSLLVTSVYVSDVLSSNATGNLGVINKAGYTATPVACGWVGAIFEVSGAV